MRLSPGPDQPANPGRDRLALPMGVGMLLFVVGLFVSGWIALLFGARPPAAAVPVAVFAAATAVGAGWGRRTAYVATVAIVGLTAGASLLAASFHDLSWDGQAYHQEAVLALARGWNPLLDAPLSVAIRPDDLWLNHYPKGAWVAEAVIFRATGHLEAAKGLQLVLLAACALLVYSALRAHGADRRRAALGAVLCAANPVALAQLYSFYVDGMTASLLTALLALAGLIWIQPRRILLLAVAAALVLLTNLKFTGLVYGAFVVAGTAAVMAWRHRAGTRRLLASGAGAMILGSLVLGFDPYVTNAIRAGHPFHPAAGSHAVDFIGIQIEPRFHQRSRIERLLLATFARASNQNVAPVPKLPLVVGRDELEALSYADTRIGGFGPLYAAALLVTLLLLVARRRLGFVAPRPALALLALAVGSALANPVVWWARYVPQLWLVPAGAATLALLVTPTARAGRFLARALALLCAVDAALVGGAALMGQLRESRAVEQQLATLADLTRSRGRPLTVSFAGFEANAERLRTHHIPFAIVAPTACRASFRLVGSIALACLDAPVPSGTR